jgi:hypothetical protein
MDKKLVTIRSPLTALQLYKSGCPSLSLTASFSPRLELDGTFDRDLGFMIVALPKLSKVEVADQVLHEREQSGRACSFVASHRGFDLRFNLLRGLWVNKSSRNGAGETSVPTFPHNSRRVSRSIFGAGNYRMVCT